MNPLALLRVFAPSLAFLRAARRELRARWPLQAHAIWQATRDAQRRLSTQRPRHGAGLNLVMRYMEWDLALYRALQAHHVSRDEAGALIDSINVAIFGPASRAGFVLSRLRGRHRVTRVRWLTDLMFRVLFTAPFRRVTRANHAAVVFDVTHCPLATYFAAHQAPELTRFAACHLDLHLAREWSMRLVRTQTLAQHATHCDFRFEPLPDPHRPDGPFR